MHAKGRAFEYFAGKIFGRHTKDFFQDVTVGLNMLAETRWLVGGLVGWRVGWLLI
jgi:hypothetical protein